MIIRPLINGGDKEQQRKEYIYPGTKQVEEIEKICGAAVTARQCQVVSERKRKRKKTEIAIRIGCSKEERIRWRVRGMRGSR